MKLTKTLAALVAMAICATSAYGVVCTVDNSMLIDPPGVIPGNPGSAYYKSDAPVGNVGIGIDSGSEATKFTTDFDGTQATITWTGPQPIFSELWIKVGNDQAGFDISSFNAEDCTSIVVVNSLILNNQGRAQEISHITLNPGTSVPEGGATVLLLGAALAAVGATRRMIKR